MPARPQKLETSAGRRDYEAAIVPIGMSLARRHLSARRLLAHAREATSSVMLRNPELRGALFRAVDVAPACASPDELGDHLRALLAKIDSPAATAIRAVAGNRLGRRVVGTCATYAIHRVARQFIVAESARAAAPALARLWQRDVAVTLDLLGEATMTQAEAGAYADRCEAALSALTAAAAAWPSRPLLERDSLGAIPRCHLSLKVTALTPQIRAQAPGRGLADAEPRVRRLLRRAREQQAHVHIDMESMDSREMILDLVLELLADPEFVDGPSMGLVLQAYYRDSEALLERMLEAARTTPRAAPLTIRLVKGAYWDHEVIDAAQKGWGAPVWTDKVDTDRCFERLTRRLIDAFPTVRPAIASHNLRSVAHAISYARSRGVAPTDVEFQVLRGLGDSLQEGLTAAGLRCRVYCPVGDMVAGMAYLVRRLLENTANESFLARRARGAELRSLLACP